MHRCMLLHIYVSESRKHSQIILLSLSLIFLILAHPDTPYALSVTLLPLITNLIVSSPRQERAVRIKAPMPSFPPFFHTFVFLLLLLTSSFIGLIIISSFFMEL